MTLSSNKLRSTQECQSSPSRDSNNTGKNSIMSLASSPSCSPSDYPSQQPATGVAGDTCMAGIRRAEVSNGFLLSLAAIAVSGIILSLCYSEVRLDGKLVRHSSVHNAAKVGRHTVY